VARCFGVQADDTGLRHTLREIEVVIEELNSQFPTSRRVWRPETSATSGSVA